MSLGVSSKKLLGTILNSKDRRFYLLYSGTLIFCANVTCYPI